MKLCTLIKKCETYYFKIKKDLKDRKMKNKK